MGGWMGGRGGVGVGRREAGGGKVEWSLAGGVESGRRRIGLCWQFLGRGVP